MNKINYLIFFVFFFILIIPLVSAYGIVSDNYNVSSYATGLSAGTPDSATQDTDGFTLTYQQGGNSVAENSEYKANIGWFVPYREESPTVTPTPTPTPPTGPSGGGGGGGGTTEKCYYNWTCTNWFPEKCPETGKQERICANRGTCKGKKGMPEETQTCEYTGPTEPLFDISLTIPIEYKELCSGDKIKAEIKLVNYGKKELLDAFLTYWIIDENSTLIAEIKDTRSVETESNFVEELKLPSIADSGNYRLYTEMKYSGNKTALAGDSFLIKSKEKCGVFELPKFSGLLKNALSILIILIKKKSTTPLGWSKSSA